MKMATDSLVKDQRELKDWPSNIARECYSAMSRFYSIKSGHGIVCQTKPKSAWYSVFTGSVTLLRMAYKHVWLFVMAALSELVWMLPSFLTEAKLSRNLDKMPTCSSGLTPTGGYHGCVTHSRMKLEYLIGGFYCFPDCCGLQD